MATRAMIDSADTHGRRNARPNAMAHSEQGRGGALAYVPYRKATEEEIWQAECADAAERIRRLGNRHSCTRIRLEDPPCIDPGHADDVEAARQALVAVGLIKDAADPLVRTAIGAISSSNHLARCFGCGRQIKTCKDGTLTAHKFATITRRGEPCPGSRTLPGKAP